MLRSGFCSDFCWWYFLTSQDLTKINQGHGAGNSSVKSTSTEHVKKVIAVSPEQGLITCNKQDLRPQLVYLIGLPVA